MANEYFFASPLISIGIFCILAIIVDGMTKSKNISYSFAVIGVIVTLILSVMTLNIPIKDLVQVTLGGLVTKNTIKFGGLSAYFDVLFCIGALLTLFAAKPYLTKENYEHSEFYNLVLYALSGMMCIAHADHLLTLFIGIEIMSISFYIMAGYYRTHINSIEAALKYFLLGAFATGFLVYGASMIYGATGTMNLTALKMIIAGGRPTILYLNLGFALLTIGLAFKIAAFPFHQWAPDVYTGSPTVVTAFMSTAGKAAAVIAFIMVGYALMPMDISNPAILANIVKAKFAIALISACTMLIGNITALVQKNVKRMLAYSSVAHAGYLLMGIVANNAYGMEGMTFYITSYLFMQFGAFVILSILEKDSDETFDLDTFSGLYRRRPFLAAMMTVFMISLAGLPPMAGFYGKYLLFTAAIQANFTWLTIVAVISSIISMYFYIGIIVKMYFADSNITESEENPKMGLAGFAVVICTIAVFLFGIFPDLVDNIIKHAIN